MVMKRDDPNPPARHRVRETEAVRVQSISFSRCVMELS
jgi:hypothetical protein